MEKLTDKRMLMMLDAYALYDATIEAIRSEAKASGAFPRGEGVLMVQLAPRTAWAYEWLKFQFGREDARDIPKGKRAHKIWADGGAVRHEEEVCLQICASQCTAETMIRLKNSEFMRVKVGVIGGSEEANRLAAQAGIKAAREYFQDVNEGKLVLRLWSWMEFSSSEVKMT